MGLLHYIDEIEDIIEAASGVPFSSKVMIDQEEVLEVIKELRLNLPDELKEASYIVGEKESILEDAKREAEIILQSAERQVENLVEEDGVTREANLKAEEIITKAQRNAKEIRLGALEYADALLENTQNSLTEIVEMIIDNRRELNED